MKTWFFLLFISVSAAVANAQTTTWTAAGNPHVVSGTYTVPAGQTLVMEPGVIVSIQANSTLQVDGQLVGNGTAANHIQINGGATGSQSKLVVAGTSDLHFTDFRALVVPDTNGVLLFADSTFYPNGGYIFNGSIVQMGNSLAPYLQFDRCAFLGDTTYNSASLYVAYVSVVLRNTTFSNGSFCSVDPGYLFVDGVNSDHAVNAGLTLGSDSDLFLNNISVTNAGQEGLNLAGDTRNGSNVLIGPNVTLQGNEYPVHLSVAGLHQASAIPSTGNQKNLIHVSGNAGSGGYWPNFSIPYYVDGSPLTVGNTLRILPGATIKMAPFSYINDIGFGDGMRAYGTKNAPIIFERADPAQGWYDLHADRTEGGRLRHVIVRGNTDGVNGGQWRLENCIIQNNGIGSSGNTLVSGTQYLNNTIGHNGGSSNLNSPTNPNTFEGNGTGVNFSPDARNNWWGSPTGPRISNNPGGTGDPIGSLSTPYQPFLVTRPDYTDAPPEVVLLRPAFQVLGGSKILLRWNSTDDVGITSHKILFSAVGNFPASFQTIATLPGDQRSYEFTIPNIGFTVNGDDAFIKVVAVDTTGKESFDEAAVIVPTNDIAGTVQFNVTAGETLNAGEMREPVYTTSGIDHYMGEVEFYLEEVKGETRKLTNRGRGGLPFFSSDTVRFVVAFGDTTNHRKYWYSPFFKIRPDSRLNDAPPAVSLVFPQAGNTFAPGSVIPISWTASDDEGLRGFDVVASYDGVTWHPVAQNLPGAARNYDWQTAPGTGFTNVRLMVIAKDWRFQTSSDGAARSFAIAGASGPTPTPSATPNPTTTPVPTATPISTATPSSTPAPTATASATATPISSSTPAPTATPSGTPVAPPAQALNISTRAQVQAGNNVLIGGFILSGPQSKKVLIRAVGPSLSANGTTAPLSDTTLDLYDSSGRLLANNDDWKDTQQTQIEATGIPPADGRESALIATLNGDASYTTIVRGKNGATGIGLVEVYDLAQSANSKLANISTRGVVEAGDQVMIGGFIIGGTAADRTRIVVRAIGPSLGSLGITNALQDPTLSLYDSNGNLLASNDNWREANQPEVAAAGLTPADDREAALFQSLAPGAYTVIVAGKGGANGVALVEAYHLQ
jgi:hypothetical protein